MGDLGTLQDQVVGSLQTPPPSGLPLQRMRSVPQHNDLELHFPEPLSSGGHADRRRSCCPRCEGKKLRGKMQEEEDGGDSSSCSAPRLPTFKSVDVADLDFGKEQAPKLCGYLNKLSGKGPLRGYKLRWFVYDPRKCYLYYFKTPQDGLPLGHIDIGDACFMYDVEGAEGQFEVRTAGKEFLLKVENCFNMTTLERSTLCLAVICRLFLSLSQGSRHALYDRVFKINLPLCAKMSMFLLTDSLKKLMKPS